MAQHDYDIENSSFPAFRTNLNGVLSAVNSSNSGTSRPSSAVAGTIWLDTSGAATAQLLKIYDGAADITLATINFTANTVDFEDSSVASDLLNDTSPQLGGNLDTNSHNILIDDAHFIGDENGLEQIIFQTTASAVNELEVTNAATGNPPILGASGETNVDLHIKPKGTGETIIGSGGASATLTTSGAYDLVLDTNKGTNSGNITIVDAANGNIQLTPNGTGYTELMGNTNSGAIRFNCESNSHGVTIKSPAHSANATYTLTLPTSDGNADEFLKTDGSGVLSWGEGGGGGMGALVHTSTITSLTSNIVIDGFFSSTYRNYKMVANFQVEGSDNEIRMRYRQGASSITTSHYRNGWNGNYSTTSASSSRYDSSFYNAAYMTLVNNIGPDSKQGASIEMHIFDPLGTDKYKHVMWHAMSESPNSPKSFMNLSGVGMYYNNTTALSGFDFYSNTDDIKGVIKVYGLL